MKRFLILTFLLSAFLFGTVTYGQSNWGVNVFYSMGRAVPGTSLDQTVGNDPENPPEVNILIANPNLEVSGGALVRWKFRDRLELQTGVSYMVNQYYSNLFSTPGLPDPVIGGPPPGAPADPNCPLTTLNRRHHIEVPVQLRGDVAQIKAVTLYGLVGASAVYKFHETSRFSVSGDALDLLAPNPNMLFGSLKGGFGAEYQLMDQFSLGAETVLNYRVTSWGFNKVMPSLNVHAGWQFGKAPESL